MNTLNQHRLAADNISVTGLPIPTRHADANAVANINVCASRRPYPIAVIVLVGAEDAPGWRTKDGATAKRCDVLEDAAKYLGIHSARITIQARYSRLASCADGTILDRNTGGYYAH